MFHTLSLLLPLLLSTRAMAVSYCRDAFGNTYRCSNGLAIGARIAIGVAIAVLSILFLVALALYRRRRNRLYNQSFIPNSGSPAQQIPMTNDQPYYAQVYTQQPNVPGATQGGFGREYYNTQQYGNGGTVGFNSTGIPQGGINYPPNSHTPGNGNHSSPRRGVTEVSPPIYPGSGQRYAPPSSPPPLTSDKPL